MKKDINDIKVAIVHDWLTGMRGGEKVLEALCEMFPKADIYTLLWNKGSVSETIESHKIRTSFLQIMPFVENKYRYYLPLMFKAIRSFYLDNYDLVISSSHCVAKGAKVKPGIPHICYCYTPMRYIWDQYEEYFNPERSGLIVSGIMSMIRKQMQKWDVETSKNVDQFVAISSCVKERIQRIYGIDSEIIYPPVDVENYQTSYNGGYYLIVSALVPYKRVDLAIKAFNKLGYQLRIIGSGPDIKRLKSIASPNIEFAGWLSDEQIKYNYAGCKAFIFPQEEDFGITSVEAQAAGKPVIAYRKGGALDTVVEGKTGIYFNENDVESLVGAVKIFENTKFSSNGIKANSLKYSSQRFKNDMAALIKRHL
jgi:glycosyltransferase involved in cell wall biosynthesis